VADHAKADAIWAALADERPWPPPPTKGANGKKLKVNPSDIRVDVHNATGVTGEGANAAEDLAAEGFGIGVVNDRKKARQETTIRHTADQLQSARTLQAAIPGSALLLDASNGATLDLTLGVDYEGVVEIRVTAARTGSGVGGTQPGMTAAQDICTG
jgi:hypothetical protein